VGTAYPAPYTPSAPAAAHGPSPKATPLHHEGRIFTLGVSGLLSAFDARTGRQLWHTQAPAEPPFFGAASSPVADGTLVIVHPGNYGPLTAFDAATGAVRWTAGPDGFFMSLIVADLGGVRHAITVTQSHVIGVSLADGTVIVSALDAKTGKTLWLGDPRQATNAAVSTSGDLLFLLDDDGELIVAKNDTERSRQSRVTRWPAARRGRSRRFRGTGSSSRMCRP